MLRAERPLNEQGLPEGYPFRPDWETTPRVVRSMRETEQDFVLLDVREPGEVAAAAIEDAVVVSMRAVPAHLDELKSYAEQKVVVLCHHGMRSLQVAAFLRQNGFGDVVSMAGGIDLWSRDIDPAVPRY